MTKPLFVAAALMLGACGIDEADEGDIDQDDTSTTEQASYSGWYYLATQYWSVQFRVCKTATRINWQFQNNTFWNVGTAGDAMSYINTYIQGVSSGSKYRTRAGTTMWWNFYSAGYGVGKTLWIPDMPNC